MRLLVGTRNPGKLWEIRAIFGDAAAPAIDLVGLEELGLERMLEEEHLEQEPTFSGNALAKARHFHDRTGLPTLADDSGLCVDALDGEPGVHSRRHAPAELRAELGTDIANNAFLIDRLQGVPDEDRTARFVCAAAVVPAEAGTGDAEHGGKVFIGRVEGRILREPRGTGGFGYDPLFYLPDLDRTLAELSPEEKNGISHRGRAIAAVRDWLHDRVAGETSGRRFR